MAAVAAALRRAVEVAGPRLVEAHYTIQISTTAGGLDAAAGVVKARRGRIVRNEPREGADLFIIAASAPVEACLSARAPAAGGAGGVGGEAGPGRTGRGRASFADELRHESSGAAAASLAPSHWERLQVLPCPLPSATLSTMAHSCKLGSQQTLR